MVPFRWTYEVWRIVGAVAARVRVNRVRVPGPHSVRKTRRWFAPIVVPLANLVLRLSSARVAMLPTSRWIRWEAAIHERLMGEHVIEYRNGVELPRRQGVSLESFLRSCDTPLSDKLAAASLAVDSLYRLHQESIVCPEGEERLFSHGDAIAANCIIGNNDAFWIDFETIHGPHQTDGYRRADDLRALIYSAAAVADGAELDALARCFLRSYPEPSVLSELDRQVNASRANVDLYRLAQAPLHWQRRSELERILLEGLDGLDELKGASS